MPVEGLRIVTPAVHVKGEKKGMPSTHVTATHIDRAWTAAHTLQKFFLLSVAKLQISHAYTHRSQRIIHLRPTNRHLEHMFDQSWALVSPSSPSGTGQ